MYVREVGPGRNPLAEPGQPEATAAPAEPTDHLAHLDALIADATARAQNADDGEETVPEDGGQAQAEPGEDTDDEPAEQAPESDASDADRTQEPPKPPSRREAARLAEHVKQLDERNRLLEQALAQRQQLDQQVTSRYGERLGTPEERAHLDALIANPDTPWDEVDRARTRMAEIRKASEELAPLYQSIESQVLQHFLQGVEGLRTLDGMTPARFREMNDARSGADAMRVAYTAGRDAAAAEYQARIAELEKTVSSLRTKRVASTTQPSAGGGIDGPPATLASMIDPRTGLLTDQAERLIATGALRDVSLTAA